jgi:hypothetical protein
MVWIVTQRWVSTFRQPELIGFEYIIKGVWNGMDCHIKMNQHISGCGTHGFRIHKGE